MVTKLIGQRSAGSVMKRICASAPAPSTAAAWNRCSGMPRIAAVKMIIPIDAPMKPFAMMISATGACGQQIDRRVEAEPAHQHLVQQPDLGRADHPEPQQDVEDRGAHARQQPDPAEEAAGHLAERRRGQRQHQAEGDVEDRERAEDVDERQPDDLRQPRIAAKDLCVLLGGELRDPERAAEVGERHRDVDEDRNDEEENGQDDRRAEKDHEVRAPARRRARMAAAFDHQFVRGRRHRPGL